MIHSVQVTAYQYRLGPGSGCPTFLLKRSASGLLTVSWATSLHFVGKYTLPQLSVPSIFSFENENSKLWIRKEWSSRPLQGKFEKHKWKQERCGESSEHTVSGTGRGKYCFEIWYHCADKLKCQWFHSFCLIKCQETQRVKMKFGRRALPQYIVYSELRNINTNYAVWIVTTRY